MEAMIHHQSLPSSSSSSASTFFSFPHPHHNRFLLHNPKPNPNPNPNPSSSSSSDVRLKSRRAVGRIVAVKAAPSERAESFSGSRPLLRPSSSRRFHGTQVHAAKQTFSSFDDLLKNTKTALLVDFYATWCGPCQFMVPVLNDVGKELKDKLRIVKIDTEKYPNIASRYGVQALPTLMLFKDGEPIDRLEGAMSARDLVKRIEAVLSASKA